MFFTTFNEQKVYSLQYSYLTVIPNMAMRHFSNLRHIS